MFWRVGDRKWVWNSAPSRGIDVGRMGCPWTAHLFYFGTVKTVPVCMKWTMNIHVFWHLNCDMNGLECVEINRLMLDVLT